MNVLWNLSQAFNYTALIHAVNMNKVKIVELLLKNEGIDVNIKDILNQKKKIIYEIQI